MLGIVTLAVNVPIAQSGRAFSGRLSPVPVAAASPDITGVGSVTATLTGTRLVISGTFEGLASPATIASSTARRKASEAPRCST